MKLRSKHLKISAVLVLIATVAVIVWGVVRKVPVIINVDPLTAVVSVDNQTVGPESKVTFGRKTIEVSNPNYTPFRAVKKVGFLSSLKISAKLRPLPEPKKIANGDLLRKDDQNRLYYRSGNQIWQSQGVGKDPLSVAQTDFSKLTDIVFSPDGKLAWIKFEDGVNGIFDFSRYNLTNQEIIRWDDGISAVVWLPSAASSDPDRARLIYLKDSVVFRTDPRRTINERLLDISSENIKNAYLEITPDEKVMMLVSNDNLYLMQLTSLTLSKVASGGVSSAAFDPNGKAVVFTQNGKLFYQKFSLPNPFSTNPDDIANIGKILVEAAKPLGINGQAKDGYFTRDGRFFTAISGNRIATVKIDNSDSVPVYHEALPTDSAGLKPFNDLNAYFVAGDSIYAITLDYGVY